MTAPSPPLKRARTSSLSRPQLDPGDVANPHERAVRVGADDDGLELLGLGQAALGLDVDLQLGLGHRLRADPTDGCLHVLRLKRCYHIIGRQLERGQSLSVEPDPHRVVERTEEIGVADSRHALDGVENVDGRVVREKEQITGLIGRVEAHHLQEGGRLLLGDHALPLRLLRELRHRLGDAVLHVDRVDVRVAADGEADGQRVAAVIAARRLHVEHVVDADDLRLDGLRHRRLDDIGASTRVGRRHLDLRRHDVRELGHRDRAHRDQPGKRDDDRDDDREARPIDEDGRDHPFRPRRPGPDRPPFQDAPVGCPR